MLFSLSPTPVALSLPPSEEIKELGLDIWRVL